MTIIYSLIKNLPLIIVGIIAIGFIIGFHELGHFIFCKIFRVKTPSFSIGFGPKIISKQIGETLFSISAIPFGGYVEIAGIEEVGQGDQKHAKSNDQFSFGTKPYYQKLLIMSGGILFNILMAYMITVLLFTLGAPKSPLLNDSPIPPIIGKVIPGLTADKYDLREKDQILNINNTPIVSSVDLHNSIKNLANQQAELTIKRNDDIINKTVVIDSIKENNQEVGKLGIEFANNFDSPISFYQAIPAGFQAIKTALIKTCKSYLSIFKNKMYGSVGGPIMIISEVSKSAKDGIRSFLLLLVIINLSLAILNLIPIPILDGGQILFTTIEAIIRRPIPETIRIGIHYICWIAAIMLTIYLSFQDIIKLLNLSKVFKSIFG